MKLFEQQLDQCPSVVREKLEKQLQETVLQINQCIAGTIRDSKVHDFTLQLLCGKIHSIFSIAREFNYAPSKRSSEGQTQDE
jgi:hypothetical protein